MAGSALNAEKIRLVKNFASLLSLRGLEFLIPLLTIPYLLRTIGVENYGLVGFAYAYAVYFGAIVQYGFGVTATRDIARSRNETREVGRLYSTVLTSSMFLAIGAVALATTIVFTVDKLRADWGLHLLSLAQIVVQSMFPIWFFQGMERMAYITYLNLCAKLIFILGLLTLVHSQDDYVYVPVLNLMSALIVLVGSLLVAKNVFKVRFEAPKWFEIREALVSSRHSFVNQLAPNLYNNSTTFLLGLLFGGYAVGLYTSATKVVDAVSSVGYIVSNTFLPYLSRSIENHGVFKKIMLVSGLGGTLFLYLFSELIGRLLLPIEGPTIAELLRMASPSVFMIFAMLTYGTNYLMLKRKEASAGRISLYTSLIFFLIAVALIPAYGVIGCMFTLVGARTCMAAALYINYRRIHLTNG